MVVEVHPFSPSTWEAEEADLCESEVSLVYKVSSRRTRATHRNCLKDKKRDRLLAQIKSAGCSCRI